MAVCKDCGGQIVPYQHPVAPEAFPPYVCARCGRFYMRSEVEGLQTDRSPQEGAHSPTAVSWHEWEPGHEGKAIVTHDGHVYTWSNGNYSMDYDPPLRPNGAYMSHTGFMTNHLGRPDWKNWHFFELDPDGTVTPDSAYDKEGYSNALKRLAEHHPGLNVSEANKWKF